MLIYYSNKKLNGESHKAKNVFKNFFHFDFFSRTKFRDTLRKFPKRRLLQVLLQLISLICCVNQ